MKNMSEKMVECENTTGEYCYAVKDSSDCRYVSESNNIHNCTNVKYCSAAYNSNNLYDSKLIYDSQFVYMSKNISASKMIVQCDTLYGCNSLTRCSECNNSINSRDCTNLKDCYFCANCNNLSNSMFCFGINEGEYLIFNQEVGFARYQQCLNQLSVMNGDIGLYHVMSDDWGCFDVPIIETRFDKMYEQMSPIFWDWVKILPGYDPILLYKITLNSELLKT